MTVDEKTALDRDRVAIECRLGELLDGLADNTGGIKDAMAYMLLDGGKRLRPLLCLWSHDALGGEARDACLDVACAIECVHTYSLVHDDLPCMDDDAVRRGRPSCHVRFGEAAAVLTGDALLTLAFEILATVAPRRGVRPLVALDVAAVLGRVAGTTGLVSGQALDLASHELPHDLATVEEIHLRKTAWLIAGSMESGAVVAEAPAEARQRAREAGVDLGRAFQIMDDVLDIEMDTETLGKTSGKDSRYGRLTYPSVSGVGPARERAHVLLEAAKQRFSGGRLDRRLGQLMESLVRRDR